VFDLELRHIEKRYGDFRVLQSVDVAVEKGEFIVMVGPSGCGKSTILKAIAGLETISSGEIWIGGRDVTASQPGDRGIAMVFQSYALYPHMTVAQNMGFGLRMAGRPKAEIDAAVERAAKILRISEHLGKLPKQLSGGQRQRVAIGRAITRSPDVSLFDEPLSNLDAALRTQMRVELSALHQALGATIVYVTHDQVEAMTMASRIVVLNKGAVEQIGSPLDLYRNPRNQFVAGFLGAPKMNFYEVEVAKLSGASVTVEADGLAPTDLPLAPGESLAPGEKALLGIRPEALRVVDSSASEAKAVGAVRLVERLGRDTILYVDCSPFRSIGSDTGTANTTAHLAETAAFSPGEAVGLTFSPSEAYLFAASDQRVVTAPKAAA
jgi:multiple sugar transport system ATP-binding protein